MKKALKIVAALVLAATLTSFLFYYLKYIKDENTLRLGIITDIHMCSTDDPAYKDSGRLTPFFNDSLEKEVDFVVNLGDSLNYGLRNCAQTTKEDLEWLTDSFKNLPMESYFVLGDHDVESSLDSVRIWHELNGQEKNYQSFEKNGFKIIILDTVLGGEAMRGSCDEEPSCKEPYEAYMALRDIQKNAEALERYKIEKAVTDEYIEAEKKKNKTAYEREEADIKSNRSAGRRDEGWISENQLEWVRRELAETDLDKVVVFGHTPLFEFVAKKTYKIANQERLHEILKNSGKEIIAISGDAHRWQEREIDGIRYHIINRFHDDGRNWALLEWKKGKGEVPVLNKIKTD